MAGSGDRPKKRSRIAAADAIVAEKTERWDMATVQRLRLLQSTTAQELTMLRKIKGHRMQVRYKQLECGRLQASCPSLQSAPGWMRRLVADGTYHDVDVANARPTLMLQLYQRHRGHGGAEELPTLTRYTACKEDREQMLGDLMERHAVDRDVAKSKLVLKAMNFGNYRRHLKTRDDPLLKALAEETNRVYHALRVAPEFENCYSACRREQEKLKDEEEEEEESKGKKRFNLPACFLSRVYFRCETQVLRCMNDFFESQGWVVGTLVHDGMLVERDDAEKRPDLAQVLRACEQHVADVTGFSVRLEEKPLEPTAEDLARLDGEVDVDRLPRLERLIYLLALHGHQQGLRRFKDHVMTPHPEISGVFLPGASALDHINAVLRSDPVFNGGVYARKLEEWFCTQDHELFPVIRPDDVSGSAVAFRDGWFDVQTCAWHPITDDNSPPPPVTFHFFDVRYADVVQRETPDWERLVKTQLYGRERFTDGESDAEREHFRVFEALIGRLFVPAGFDNWQRWLFLKGGADTGKSTVLEVVRRMFPTDSVTSFDGGRRREFTLEDIVDSRLMLIPDVPRNLHQVLQQDVFLSMVSAESVSVSRLYKTTRNVQWRVPALMAGNVIPSYDDDGGRVVRRLAVFSFDTLIRQRDTELKTRIFERELPSILLHCVAAYHALRARVGSDELRQHLPPGVLKSEEEIRMETNVLFAFLQNGDQRCQVVHEEGAQTPLTELKRAFQNHVKFHLRDDAARWPSNYRHAIEMAGFTVERVNVCKVCDARPATRDSCGEHWANGQNRRRAFVVQGMQLRMPS